MQGSQAALRENRGTYSQMTDENNRPTHPIGARNNISGPVCSPSEGQQRKKAPVSALEGLLSLDYFDPGRNQQERVSNLPPPALDGFVQKDIGTFYCCQCGLSSSVTLVEEITTNYQTT